MSTQATIKQSYKMRAQDIPKSPIETISVTEQALLSAQIKQQLKEQNAVVVAHYYTDPTLQILADETGGYVSDSLDMARFGYESDAKTLIVCGVRFMGETAKILNPEKRILMPDLNATCSLDIGCPADDFTTFCDNHPDHVVVVYANTSAAVKARADWMVTSGSATKVVEHLSTMGKKIIWAPDQYLGDYVQQQTKADMLIWQGACIVHEEFKGTALRELRKDYPDAKILVHPESPASVIAQADLVSSTTGLIDAVSHMDAQQFIVATDKGIFHKMQQAASDKILIEAPTAGKSASCISCGHCPWMAMNNLKKVAHILATGDNEVTIDADIIHAARRPIQRLLDFTSNPQQLANDA